MKKEKIAKTSDAKVTQITLPDERYYKVGDKYLPSVTWILESYPKGIGFYKWLASEGWNEAITKKEAAGDRGSKVHNAIQDLLKGKEIKWGAKYWSELDGDYSPLTIEEWEALVAFTRFWEEKKPQLIATERVCWSEKEGFAGTLDALIVLGGKKTVIDFKTSSRIYTTYPLQVAAYFAALMEKKYEAQQTAILRIGTNHKSGYELKVFMPEEIAVHFDQFKAVKAVWAIENKDKQPDLVEIPESLQIKIQKPNGKQQQKKSQS